MKAELGLVVIYAMAHFANLTKYLNKICIIWPAEACCRGMMGRDILAKSVLSVYLDRCSIVRSTKRHSSKSQILENLIRCAKIDSVSAGDCANITHFGSIQ